MDAQLLTQADFTLNRCGRPTAPSGLSSVYLYKAFMVQNYFPVTPGTTTQQLVKEITGETTWCLRAIEITSSTATALSLQILLPNGHFLINNLQDSLQIAGYGSYRYLFAKELECPPGSKIQVTFADTNTSVAQPQAILFEGAYKYLLKGAGKICTTLDAAANMPRYFGDFNENIMAPCWAHGVGPATPTGLSDIEWTYGPQGLIALAGNVSGLGLANTAVNATSIDVANGPFQATQVIPIDSGSDFRCRRLLFGITADSTVTAGTILCRVRTGSGYALTDDYLDAATYIGSSWIPKDWEIKAADNVYVDMQLVDQTGTGLIYLQTFLEGTKRRRAL
jgi:hypothetical protein